MPLQEVIKLLQAAIEASVYIAPTEPGLTGTELYEVGSQLGFKEGEIGDAMPQVATQYFGGHDRRLLLAEHLWQMPGFLIFREDPDLRKEEAFDFVVSQLNDLVREVGGANARLDRSIMVDRAVAKTISRHDVEVAITLMVLSGQLAEKDGVLRFKSGGERELPSTSRNQAVNHPRHRKPARTRVMPHVKDVIERRTDTRPQSAEPFAAFAEQLAKLGYGQFRLWWNQTVAELGRSDPNSSPLSALVLAAALVEGALTFVVSHARGLGIGVFGSNDFAGDPRTWRIEKLVAGAAHNGAILDSLTKNGADRLIQTRQRIHAGRMLSAFPKGVPVPDLRPEEARDAKAVSEQIVRSVIDWLSKYPPP